MIEENCEESFECDISEHELFPSCLILAGASDSYLALLGWDRSYIGSEIETIYNYRETVIMKEIFSQLRKSSESLTYLREISDRVWRIDALFSQGKAHYKGSRLRSPNEAQRYALSCQISQVSLEFMQKVRVESVLLRERGGEIKVESVSESLSRATGLSYGGYASVVRPFLYCLNPERVASWCIKYDVSTRYPDIYVRGGITMYLMLEYTPLRNTDNYVAVFIHKLSREEFYSLQMPFIGIPPQMLPTTNQVAYAMLDYDGGKFVPGRCNHVFWDIMSSGDIMDEVMSRLLPPCQTPDNIKCFIVADGITRYFCAAVYSADGGCVHLSVLKFNELQSEIDSCLRGLSPREREITLFIIDGMSNREIAKKLVIAEGTVKKTISNIYAKLGINSKIELIQMVLRYNP